MKPYRYDYVIIFALQEEFEQFKCALCSYRSNIDKNPENDYHHYYRLYKKNDEINETLTIKNEKNKKFKIFAKTQNIAGMISAGICATKLIDEYRPKHIVLLGIAAGFGQEYGSVLIADFVSAYQQGKLEDGVFFPDGAGINLADELKNFFNKKKKKIISEVRKHVFAYNNDNNHCFKKNNQIENIEAYVGPVATSIQVIADKDQENIIKGTQRKAIGIEMEGYGIFRAAEETPRDYRPIPILIKSVCDHANNEKNDNHHDLSGFTSSYFFLKHLEFNEIQPEKDLPNKSNALFLPLGYSERNEYYGPLINNAGSNSDICLISITADSDLRNPKFIDDQKYLSKAIAKGLNFKVIVVNPTGHEAVFRNDIESPNKSLKNTILFEGAEGLKNSLNAEFWQNENIEVRYSRVGLQFKLWLTGEYALIEPYHFGREPDKDSRGLCGFSQTLYKKDDREYKILWDHFEKLWERSDPFWPEKDSIPPWDIDENKKEEITKKIN